ncbi:EpsG family protein [Paenisporosarcina antarctica]|uniref:EpsG family protein n=1 Tax=Paenisporosarcina antarctica TaxID=417367 RepID=A0A4P6ZZJ8_9BACL|nr:EpsG family protein [Paenisporosarcina antarctica]QBP42011.1 EpsG family protein [Paenisporosarcina antarctica]
MISYILLLWGVFLISLITTFNENKIFKSNSVDVISPKIKMGNHLFINQFLLMIIIILLSIFAGSRISYNDTFVYIRRYTLEVPTSLFSLDPSYLEISNNPAFWIYQTLIKSYISTDPQIFIAISSVLYIMSFVYFYWRFSPKFGMSIFLFITLGLFLLGMAAIKQILAISIGIWAVYFASEKKWVKFFLLVLLASLFHPFALLYLLIPLIISKDVWTVKTFFMIITVFVIGSLFESFINVLMVLTGNIKDYSESSFEESVSIFRVLVYGVPVFLSFIYKRNINEHGNHFIKLCINASVVSFLFMVLSFFGGAILFSRAGAFFSPMSLIALPWILVNCIPRKQKIMIYYLFFTLYFIYFFYGTFINVDFSYKSIFSWLNI